MPRLNLKRVGFQRYQATLPDGRKVAIGREETVLHGTFPANRRQRREPLWRVKIEGQPVGEARTFLEARALAEEAAFRKVAPETSEVLGTPNTPEPVRDNSMRLARVAQLMFDGFSYAAAQTKVDEDILTQPDKRAGLFPSPMELAERAARQGVAWVVVLGDLAEGNVKFFRAEDAAQQLAQRNGGQVMSIAEYKHALWPRVPAVRVTAASIELVDKLAKRWPQHEQDIRALAANDPTGDLRWLDWSVKQLRAGAQESDITKALRAFFAHRDTLGEPTRHKTLHEAQQAVEAVEQSVGSAETGKSEIIYSAEGWTVTQIFDRAALFAAVGCQPTSWCVGWNEMGHWDAYARGAGWRMYVVRGPTAQSPYLVYLGGAKQNEIKNRGNGSVRVDDAVHATLEAAGIENVNVTSEVDEYWANVEGHLADLLSEAEWGINTHYILWNMFLLPVETLSAEAEAAHIITEARNQYYAHEDENEVPRGSARRYAEEIIDLWLVGSGNSLSLRNLRRELSTGALSALFYRWLPHVERYELSNKSTEILEAFDLVNRHLGDSSDFYKWIDTSATLDDAADLVNEFQESDIEDFDEFVQTQLVDVDDDDDDVESKQAAAVRVTAVNSLREVHSPRELIEAATFLNFPKPGEVWEHVQGRPSANDGAAQKVDLGGNQLPESREEFATQLQPYFDHGHRFFVGPSYIEEVSPDGEVERYDSKGRHVPQLSLRSPWKQTQPQGSSKASARHAQTDDHAPDEGPLDVPLPVFEPGTPWHLRWEQNRQKQPVLRDVLKNKLVQLPPGAPLPAAPTPDLSGADKRKEWEPRLLRLLPAQYQQTVKDYNRQRYNPEDRAKLHEDAYKPARAVPPDSTVKFGEDIKLETDGGHKNIVEVLKAARPDQIEYWRHWYVHAGTDAQALAKKYGVPPHVVSAIIAALSPNVKWEDNVFAAEQILRGRGVDVIEYRKKLDALSAENYAAKVFPDLYLPRETLGTFSYATNIEKAQRILDSWTQHSGFDGRIPQDEDDPTKQLTLNNIQVDWTTAPPKTRRAPGTKKDKGGEEVVVRGNEIVYVSPDWARKLFYNMTHRGYMARYLQSGKPLKSGAPSKTWNAGDVMDEFDASAGRMMLSPPISGPKVTAFYESITSPETARHKVVLDGHAQNIWYGSPQALNDMEESTPPSKLRQRMVDDYRAVAAQSPEILAEVYRRHGKDLPTDLQNLTAQQVQAITWTVWRDTIEDIEKTKRVTKTPGKKKKRSAFVRVDTFGDDVISSRNVVVRQDLLTEHLLHCTPTQGSRSGLREYSVRDRVQCRAGMVEQKISDVRVERLRVHHAQSIARPAAGVNQTSHPMSQPHFDATVQHVETGHNVGERRQAQNLSRLMPVRPGELYIDGRSSVRGYRLVRYLGNDRSIPLAGPFKSPEHAGQVAQQRFSWQRAAIWMEVPWDEQPWTSVVIPELPENVRRLGHSSGGCRVGVRVTADDVHPHTSVPEPHGDEQVVEGANAGNYYTSLASSYGAVTPGQQTSLKFYDYGPHAQAIDDLAKAHGYEVYLAGGKYGRPDLTNKTYTTGHLMIYDPSPGSGGDFGEEQQTKAWRTIHELSHALTYQELNAKYGEGRRIGKLGQHRTPREAKRAVEWEHLAALKQRELSKQLGYSISDEDFAREYNTVLSDAVHRAVTGKFTNPDQEGFVPHTTPVSLEHSLGKVDEAARTMGLAHDEALLPKARVAEGRRVAQTLELTKWTSAQPSAPMQMLPKGKRLRYPEVDPRVVAEDEEGQFWIFDPEDWAANTTPAQANQIAPGVTDLTDFRKLRGHVVRVAAVRVEAAGALGLRELQQLVTLSGTFGVLAAYDTRPLEGPLTKDHKVWKDQRPPLFVPKSDNQAAHGRLIAELQRRGYTAGQIRVLRGHWGGRAEQSVLVIGLSFADVINLGKMFDQESVIWKGADGILAVYNTRGAATAAPAKDETGAIAIDTSPKVQSKSKDSKSQVVRPQKIDGPADQTLSEPDERGRPAQNELISKSRSTSFQFDFDWGAAVPYGEKPLTVQQLREHVNDAKRPATPRATKAT